jgi:hypothetical protein
MVGTMPSSAQPMFMAWGLEPIFFYNDTYRPLLGKKAKARWDSLSRNYGQKSGLNRNR